MYISSSDTEIHNVIPQREGHEGLTENSREYLSNVSVYQCSSIRIMIRI